MEVKSAHSAMLSNYEVLVLLKEIKQNRSRNKPTKNLSTIVYETIKYLEELPCRTQSPEAIAGFLDALRNVNLTKAEKLQLLNHQPTSPVELQLLIEECVDRFSESQEQELIDLVTEKLPQDPKASASAMDVEGPT